MAMTESLCQSTVGAQYHTVPGPLVVTLKLESDYNYIKLRLRYKEPAHVVVICHVQCVPAIE